MTEEAHCRHSSLRFRRNADECGTIRRNVDDTSGLDAHGSTRVCPPARQHWQREWGLYCYFASLLLLRQLLTVLLSPLPCNIWMSVWTVCSYAMRDMYAGSSSPF